MTTNHTPGEWRTVKHGTPEHSPQYGVCSEDGRDLATFTGPNAKANATLAAAAPDMLAALKQAESALEDRRAMSAAEIAGVLGTIRAALFRAEA